MLLPWLKVPHLSPQLSESEVQARCSSRLDEIFLGFQASLLTTVEAL